MTASFDENSKENRTEFICSGKSEAEVTNSK